MKITTSLKILMCTSALAFAGVGTASAHQHESGEAAAQHMKDKAKDKAVDMATDKAKEMVKGEATEAVTPETEDIGHKMEDGTMMKGASHSMKEKAGDMAMDKAKGMAKKEVLGEAGSGVAGKMEHSMKEKAMDHAMDKGAEHAKGMMMKEGAKGAEGAAMPAKAESVVMETPAVENAAPASQPAKLLTFDEALSACRGAADLQACIDERTGQGAMRQQIHNSRPGS